MYTCFAAIEVCSQEVFSVCEYHIDIKIHRRYMHTWIQKCVLALIFANAFKTVNWQN